MSLPSTPELNLKTAQYNRLLAVSAGADWHTDLGAGVYLWPQADESPTLHCWPSEVTTEARGDGASAVTSITWTGFSATQSFATVSGVTRAPTCAPRWSRAVRWASPRRRRAVSPSAIPAAITPR